MTAPFAFITNQARHSMSVINTRTMAVTDTFEAGRGAVGIAASGNGARLFVSDWIDDAVSVLDAWDGRERARLPTGRNPRAFGSFMGDVPPSRPVHAQNAATRSSSEPPPSSVGASVPSRQ